MKKIYEAYNIKEELINDTEDEDSVEGKETVPPYQPTQGILTFSYESEDDENRRNLFRKISTIIGVIGLIWLFANNYLITEFKDPNSMDYLIVRALPGLILILSRIFAILGVEIGNDRTVRILREIFWIFICVVYLFNEISRFMANFN